MADELTLSLTSVTQNTSVKIVNALMFGFPLNELLEREICADQSCSNINAAIKKWLKNTLIINDKEVAHLLMPLITRRFNDYINQVSRSCSYE
jgi:hypothetical protein